MKVYTSSTLYINRRYRLSINEWACQRIPVNSSNLFTTLLPYMTTTKNKKINRFTKNWKTQVSIELHSLSADHLYYTVTGKDTLVCYKKPEKAYSMSKSKPTCLLFELAKSLRGCTQAIGGSHRWLYALLALQKYNYHTLSQQTADLAGHLFFASSTSHKAFIILYIIFCLTCTCPQCNCRYVSIL